jgi:hypothetical protein
MASEALHATWRRSTYLWWWMDMHRDGCSGECDHTRSFLCTPLPLRTPNNVHKKDPGRGRMREPKPTRAFYGHGRTYNEIPRNAQQGSK